MKVKDLIAKLQEFNPELPVCLADWQEEYQVPSEHEAEHVTTASGNYLQGPTVDSKVAGEFVCIGSSRK